MAALKDFIPGEPVRIIQARLIPLGARAPENHAFEYYFQYGEVVDTYTVYKTPVVLVLNTSLGDKRLEYRADCDIVLKEGEPLPDIFSGVRWQEDRSITRIPRDSPRIVDLGMTDMEYIAKLERDRMTREAQYIRDCVADYHQNPTSEELFAVLYHIGESQENMGLFSDEELDTAYENSGFTNAQIEHADQWLKEHFGISLKPPESDAMIAPKGSQ